MGVFLDLCNEIDIFNYDCKAENISLIEKVKLKIRLKKLNKAIEKLISLPNLYIETIYEFMITFDATKNIIKVKDVNFDSYFSEIHENYFFSKTNDDFLLECKMSANYNNNLSIRFFDKRYSNSSEKKELVDMDFQNVLSYQGENERVKLIVNIANDSFKEAIGKYLLCRLRG